MMAGSRTNSLDEVSSPPSGSSVRSISIICFAIYFPKANSKISPLALSQRLLSMIASFRFPSCAAVEPLSKDAILRLTRVVMTAKEASQIVDKIMMGAGSGGGGGGNKSPPGGGPGVTTAVAVDGEGINLGTKGQLTLLQISTAEKQTYIFDLMADPTMWNEGMNFESCSTRIIPYFLIGNTY